MKKQLLFAFGAAALLASCSNDIDTPVANGNDGYLRVFGTIDEIKTRATDTSFQTDDVIGVTTDEGSTYSAYKFNGTSFEAEEEGIKVASTLNLSAYFPYQENVTDNEISFDVSNQSGVDFLFASGVTVTPENPTANFTFKHKMSKLAFTVKDVDNQFTNGETFKLEVSKVATTGKFNISTGAVEADGATGSLSSDISLNTAKSFIVPSSAQENEQAISLVVTVSNGDTYLANVTPKLVAGTQYNYTLNIKKDTPDMSVGGGVSDWEKEEEEIDTEKGEKPYELAIGDFLLKDGTTIAPSKLNDEDKENVVGVVFFVGNPCPQTVSDYSEDNDVLFQDFYKGKLEYSVVTEIDATAHGLAVAINNANNGQTYGGYASSKIDITTVTGSEKFLKGEGCGNATPTTQFLGYNYTNIIKNVDTASTGLENIKNIITSYETGVSSDKLSGWFLPTVAEFNKILEFYSKVNPSITKVNGTLDQFDDFTTDDPNDKFYWTSEQRNGSNQWISPLSSSYSGNSWLDKTQTKKGYVGLCIAF